MLKILHKNCVILIHDTTHGFDAYKHILSLKHTSHYFELILNNVGKKSIHLILNL